MDRLTTTTVGITIARMSVNVEIITTGTELLLGELVDTNSAYIARRLRTIGVNLFYITSVGDNQERMAGVLTQALERSDVIITTGGLGPTVDDVTREAVSQATGRALVMHPELMAQIEARFNRWGRGMTENNRRQAYLPADSVPMENPVGTAPCFIVEEPHGTIISLPGVPREMEYLIENAVIPYLRRRFDLRDVIKAKVLKTCAVGESTIDDRITDLMKSFNPTVGLAAHPAQTDVRITAKAASEPEADRLIADMEAEIRKRLGDAIYGTDKQRLEDVVAELLGESKLNVAVLETVTHGAIARRLASASNGRELVRVGRVLDETPAQLESQLSELLGMTPDDLHRMGVPSRDLAVAAARRMREVSGADLGLAVIGVGAVDEQSYAPVSGSVWCALDTPEGAVSREFRLGGEFDTLVPWTSGMALDVTRRALLGRKLHPDY
jgi:nicotinamide-nucleotide amidase